MARPPSDVPRAAASSGEAMPAGDLRATITDDDAPPASQRPSGDHAPAGGEADRHAGDDVAYAATAAAGSTDGDVVELGAPSDPGARTVSLRRSAGAVEGAARSDRAAAGAAPRPDRAVDTDAVT